MHAIAQVSMPVIQQQVNVVIHKALCDDIHFELLAFRSYQPNQIEPIISILKYQLTTTALLDDMVIAVNRDFPRGPSHTHLLLYRQQIRYPSRKAKYRAMNRKSLRSANGR